MHSGGRGHRFSLNVTQGHFLPVHDALGTLDLLPAPSGSKKFPQVSWERPAPGRESQWEDDTHSVGGGPSKHLRRAEGYRDQGLQNPALRGSSKPASRSPQNYGLLPRKLSLTYDVSPSPPHDVFVSPAHKIICSWRIESPPLPRACPKARRPETPNQPYQASSRRAIQRANNPQSQ